jgi:superfamily II DNA or RNA helicase
MSANLLAGTVNIAPPILRDYQHRALGWLRASYRAGHKAPLLCLPTGGGKTMIFAEAARLAALRGTRTLIAVHRHELLWQAVAKLRAVGLEPGVIAAGFDSTPDATVQVAAVQTAVRRDIGLFGLLIADESQHAVSATWRTIIDNQPDARLFGCTATPARLDGKGLGREHGGIFDNLIIGATVAELIAGGWLCRFRVFVATTKLNLHGVHSVAGDYNRGELADAVLAADLSGDAVAEYRKHADHRPAIAFCITVAHAEATALAFRSAGYRAAAIHGELAKPERDRLLEGLRTGAIEVLTSCEILGEGVDVPAIGCAILLRPTQSLAVYLQQVGRGLRPAPGKDHLVILDLAGNAIEHGLPDEERDWTLAGAPKRQRQQLVIDDWGEVQPRELVTDPSVALVELNRAQLEHVCRMPYRVFVGGLRSDAEIAAYRRHHGYKPGWDFYTKRLMAELVA